MTEVVAIEGAELLTPSVRGGNQLYKVDDEFVLKLYRVRGSRLQELGRAISNRFFEGKRSVTAASRFETEKQCLALWAEHGFDVFRTFDKPLPKGVEPPALWLEFCTGRNFGEILMDAEVPWETKPPIIERIAADMARRHEVALDLSEPLLIPEHPTPNHIFVSGDRLISFDFENAYRSGVPIMELIGRELAGFLRGLARRGGEAHIDSAIEAFVRGYANPTILKEAATSAVSSGGVIPRLRRAQDKKRRPTFSKTEMLHRLLDHIDESAS